jgi:RNA polymerase sigma factor (sigma-70 family)
MMAGIAEASWEGRVGVESDVARLRRGDTDALGALLERYQNRLYRYLLRMVREPAAAEDLFQQTWLRVAEQVRRYDPRRSFDVWFFTVARNLALDSLRRYRPESLDEPLATGGTRGELLAREAETVLDRVIFKERAARLGEVLLSLPARILSALVYVCGTALFFTLFQARPEDWKNWDVYQKVPFALLIPLFVAVWVLLVGYVNGDAKRRGMRRVMWTLLAIFVPNALGIILYFLLRDPLPSACPGCGNMVAGSFAFCPHCGIVLTPACPNCRRSVERTWANCAHCGTKLPGANQPSA